jgi:hypothetical protein
MSQCTDRRSVLISIPANEIECAIQRYGRGIQSDDSAGGQIVAHEKPPCQDNPLAINRGRDQHG